jgi:DNA-binding transcriptional MocR family regulator
VEVVVQPSDVVVLFALLNESDGWTMRSVAERLGVQHSKVQRGLERLADAGLYDANRRRVVPHATEEFVEHALKYLHPAREGPIVRGVPTAWAASPLKEEIATDDLPPVWPDPKSNIRGQAVEPLDKSLPELARTWPDVAELAALADALRLGDARSRAAAQKHLHDRIYSRL